MPYAPTSGAARLVLDGSRRGIIVSPLPTGSDAITRRCFMSTTGSGRVQHLLDDQIEPFLQRLRDAGYAERTLRKKRTVARAFARWAKRKGIGTIDLNDGHVDAFVRRLHRGEKSRLKFELAGVQLFLGYL